MSDERNIAERRARVADALQLIDEILIVGAGEPVPLPEGSDQTYPLPYAGPPANGTSIYTGYARYPFVQATPKPQTH